MLNEKIVLVLIVDSFAGSNTWALYNKHLNRPWEDFDVVLTFKDTLQRKMDLITRARIIITTFMPLKIHESQICIQTWHGFPLKTLGMRDRFDEASINYMRKIVETSDFWLSYSTTYTTIINSCFPQVIESYLLTGMPRNDFLFVDRSIAVEKLSKLVSIDKYEKIVLYCPTYRSTNLRKDSNIFVSDLLNILLNSRDFIAYLEENRVVLIVKLHPFEEYFVNKLRGTSDHIRLLRNFDLFQSKTDLYELLPAFDLLITDYSSIYFDWLLLDKPIVFFIPDLSSYQETRDFLLSPLDFWMPGIKCKTVSELIEAFEDLKRDRFKDERKRLKRIVHHYQDGQSCDRVFLAIKEIIEGKITVPKIRLKHTEGTFLPIDVVTGKTI